MDFAGYFKTVSHWIMTSGLRVILIVILTLIALRVARFLSVRIFALKKERDIEF